MTNHQETILAWHFATLNNDGKPILGYGDGREIVVGETLTVDCEPLLCEAGLHASEHAIDALYYAPSFILCRVEVGGVIKRDRDELVGTSRKCLSIHDVKQPLLFWVCDFAEGALRTADVKDKQPYAMLDVKRKWIRGEVSTEECCAAKKAAYHAYLITNHKTYQGLACPLLFALYATYLAIDSRNRLRLPAKVILAREDIQWFEDTIAKATGNS